MRAVRALLLRLTSLFRRTHHEAELTAELESHLALDIDERLKTGTDPAEARRQALLRLGSVDSVKESYRDRRGLPLIETTLQDLRYALRTLRSNAAFTITALVTLALTMGAVSTVLSLYNALLLRPIAASRPEELVVVAAVHRNAPSSERVSYADYAHIRDHSKTLQELAAHCSGGLFLLTYNGITKKVSPAIVSASFFSLLGVKPSLGRLFSADEDRVPGRDNVAVLSDHLWREGWGATATALGAVVKVNGVPFTVIGVAPKGFHGVDPRPSEVYIPTMMLGAVRGLKCDAIADPACGPAVQMIGRLRAGRSLDDVKAEAPTLAPEHWRTNAKNTKAEPTARMASSASPTASRRDHPCSWWLVSACSWGVRTLEACCSREGAAVRVSWPFARPWARHRPVCCGN